MNEKLSVDNVTAYVAEFGVNLEFDQLPGEVVHEVKRLFLDSMACAIAGQFCEKGELAVRLAKRLGGPPESTIIGTRERVSSCNAAFANGELINALDWDALCPRHYPPIAIPPALALAECVEVSGKDLIAAIALALELMARLGTATTGFRSFEPEKQSQAIPAVQGYSSCIFGAVAGAGKVLKLDVDKMNHALGIGGHLAPVSGAGKFHRTLPTPMTKYASTGWLAQTAVTSALLADMGYTGDTTVLEGEYGFWRFSGSQVWHPNKVTDRLGENWLFMAPGLGYKEYPACGQIMAGLDCLTYIMAENNLKTEDIESVTLWLDPLAEYPLMSKRQEPTHIDAQFDFALVVAIAAHRVPVGAEWQSTKTIQDARIREFTNKVTIAPHPEFVKAKLEDYGTWLSKVRITANGKVHEKEARYPKFAKDPSHPQKPGMRDEDLVNKFRGSALEVLGKDKTDKAIESILRLETLKDVAALSRLLAN